MDWKNNFKLQTMGPRILWLFLLSLIILGSSGAAEDHNGAGAKPATVTNLEFVNIDLRQALRYLAGVGGFQTLLSPEVHGVMNIAFKAKIPAASAAETLATVSDLNYQWLKNGTTLYIGNSNPIDSPLKSRVLTLKYLNPVIAVNALTVVIPKSRITVDASVGDSGASKENRLTISASELEWQNIIEITQALDRVLPPLKIDTRLIELPENYFRELKWYSFQTPIQMGAFLFPSDQLNLMESHSQYSVLYRREIPVSESQAGRLTLEDPIPKVQENSQEGSVNYQIENLTVGMDLGVALQPGSGNKLTLWITVKVDNIINTTPPKDGTGYTPVPGARELTSVVAWEPGQKILFSGVMQRSEFTRLLDIPYKFPVLNDLFLGKNIIQPAQNSAMQTAIIMSPLISNESGANSATIPSPTKVRTESQLIGSDFSTLPDATEEKVTLTLGSGKVNPTPTFRRGLTQAFRQTPTPTPTATSRTGSTGITQVPYVVKKGDTLTRIAAKFGVTVQAIISENNLDLSGAIKDGMTLSIPVNSNRIYTIKPKETIWRIAKRYGVTIEELKDLNGIADTKKVEAGQQIVLPVPVHQIKNPQF